MFFLEISDTLSGYFPGRESAFAALVNLEGKVVCERKDSRTIHFERGGGFYEILVARGTRAKATWDGLEKLNELGIAAPKLVGKGIHTNAFGVGKSFTITEANQNSVTLDALLVFPDDHPDAAHYRLKHHCLDQIGDIAGRMHRGGMVHREFSLDGLQIPSSNSDRPLIQVRPPRRLKLKSKVSPRDQIKDLGRLLTSSFDENLEVTEAMRFIRAYLGKSWKDLYRKDRALWYRVISRAMMERAMKQRRERRLERKLRQ